MRGVSQIKGVADIRTAVSARLRSTSRHKASSYLEVMALGMDKLRMEGELGWLGRREERIRKRLAEVKTLLQTRISEVQEDDLPGPKASGPGEQPAPGGGPWRTMPVQY